MDSDGISCYFCSATIFKIRKKLLSNMQVKFMEKGLDYVPILSKVNEPVRDMEDFARGMRLNHTHMEELVLY